MAWPKGKPRPPGAGRKAGTPNKVTRAAKEFMAELCDDPEVQAAVRERIVAGDAALFFRAVEQIMGKPKQQIEANVHDVWMLPAGDDVAD